MSAHRGKSTSDGVLEKLYVELRAEVEVAREDGAPAFAAELEYHMGLITARLGRRLMRDVEAFLCQSP